MTQSLTERVRRRQHKRNRTREHTHVHFHRGPQGQPMPCYDQQCQSPRLSLCD